MAKEILKLIKQSKKYKHLSNEVIENSISKYQKQNPKWQEYKPEYVIKEIKSKLHDIYGSFQNRSKKKIDKYLEDKDIDSILKTNKSTKERINDYSSLYKEIYKITESPKTILDLGAGLNPCAYSYFPNKPKYFAYDINEEDTLFLNNFFKSFNIDGKAETLDLANINNLKKLPTTDLCFMFKVIDPIEKQEKGHKLAEEIIESLKTKCKFLVISFATKTLSGRRMNFPHRGWIERLLERLNLKYNKILKENEIYYVIQLR